MAMQPSDSRTVPPPMPSIVVPRRSLAVLALTLLAVACDGMTFPNWETEWAVQSDATVALAAMMPSTVGLDGDAFVVGTSPVAFQAPLGLMCTTCSTAAGTARRLPKPAFAFQVTTRIGIPADLDSLELGSGDTLRLTIGHSLPFDPLRPSAEPGSPTGRLHVVVASGSLVLADLVRDGAEGAWPAGDSLRWAVPLADHSVLSGDVAITVGLESPAGDSAAAPAPDASLGLTANLGALRVRSVNLRLRDQVVATDVDVDLSGLGSDVLSRADSVAVRIGVANPYAIVGTVMLDWATPGVPADTVALLPSGSVTYSRPLTKPMLEALAGRTVRVHVAGVLSASAVNGYVRLRPVDGVTFVVAVRAALSSATVTGVQ